MNKNYIGENIRLYRERKNITQRELADRIGKTWEMISRYERGVSSPLNQMDNIANALNVDVTDLLKDHTKKGNEYSFNRVPLFNKIPNDLDFINTKSYIYYVVPDWILDVDRNCFVVDTQIIDIHIDELDRKGYLYISPSSIIDPEDIVLEREKDKIVLRRAKRSNSKNIIGKVLSQEIIFE
jgi:transcriptional regulator with XRE-family HTH domain